MAEDMMDNEMAGIGMPPAEEGMDTAEKAPMAEPVPETMPEGEEAESKFDMETMMGNYMDLDEQTKRRFNAVLGTGIKDVIDQVLGEPVMDRLVLQLGEIDQAAGPATPMEEPAGMMAPATDEPMADMPMEEEEATPPV